MSNGMNDSDLDELISNIKEGHRPTIMWGVLTVAIVLVVVLS